MAKIHNFGGDYALHNNAKTMKENVAAGTSESAQPERTNVGEEETGYTGEKEGADEMPSASSKKASKKKR